MASIAESPQYNHNLHHHFHTYLFIIHTYHLNAK